MSSRNRILSPSASRSQIFRDLFQGSIADAFLPNSESSLHVSSRRLAPPLAASPDCGTYFLGCPNATQDPDACPTADTGLPSCGLCPDTNTPPAGHCHEGYTDDCAPTSGNCPPPPPPDTVRGCFSTHEGCPPDTSDCYSTQHCENTVANCGPFTECETYPTYPPNCADPHSVDDVRCIAPPD
jgi:hypothetical protein